MTALLKHETRRWCVIDKPMMCQTKKEWSSRCSSAEFNDAWNHFSHWKLQVNKASYSRLFWWKKTGYLNISQLNQMNLTAVIEFDRSHRFELLLSHNNSKQYKTAQNSINWKKPIHWEFKEISLVVISRVPSCSVSLSHTGSRERCFSQRRSKGNWKNIWIEVVLL